MQWSANLKQAGGFAGAGGENDGASVDAFLGEGGFIDVRDAFGLAVFADERRSEPSRQ